MIALAIGEKVFVSVANQPIDTSVGMGRAILLLGEALQPPMDPEP